MVKINYHFEQNKKVNDFRLVYRALIIIFAASKAEKC
jgi:hypothetical protein